MQTKINKPSIPASTMKEMSKFFMKTSVPRILAARKEEANKAKEEGK
ncbi:hypothetical protein [Sediminibacillus massiliensis]|nr:hypothetical protein [Sediminibacillus massiliensis]